MLLRAILGLCVSHALAHGSHGHEPTVPEDANWMTKHMAEEHHMDGWDADSFFALHDYNSDGVWQRDELLRTYGLFDESNKEVTLERKKELGNQLMELLDEDEDDQVSKAEFKSFMDSGKTLPDLGVGPGHHGDDEYEFEIHHWEKYHDENTKLEDLTHPEDIEHFRKHEQMELAEEKQEKMDTMSVIEENIPARFRSPWAKKES